LYRKGDVPDSQVNHGQALQRGQPVHIGSAGKGSICLPWRNDLVIDATLIR
jgi:hypothetical protein